MHGIKTIEDLQKAARGLGGVFTVLAAAMSAAAGWKFGGDSTFACIVLAALLAGLTVAVAILLSFVDAAWAAGEKSVAAALGLVFVLAAFGEYASHVAFGTGHRAHNIEQASIQTARYDDARDSVAENKRSIAMWEARLAELEKTNAWTASVTADALRAQAEAESKRGGCGPKCLDLKAKIAIAEESADLRKQIAATKKVLVALREKSAGTEKGDSIAVNQSMLFATAATGSLAPTASAIAWANIGIGAYLALLSTSLGAVFNWLGFRTWRRRPGDAPDALVPQIETALPLSNQHEPRAIAEQHRSEALKRWAAQHGRALAA
jgi:hypothetical protein